MRVPADVSGSVQSDRRRRWEANLVDDQPPRLVRVLSSHPPVRDRVMAALRQAGRVARTQGAVAGRPS